ncbi:unnamed protein product [Vicia faba]|uniref:Uncharacterized protein n=1 Tax=Vicia faba TaxID=3906 RepID=A0AAV1AS01_VICFA|nr:unnamed protein product [Vicia faba]
MYVLNISLHNISLDVKSDLTTSRDKNVAHIQYEMLTESQVHKENDDHVHEDVEVYISIDDGGVNNHDHAFEDVKTLGEGVNESICTNKGKEYRLI